MFRIVLIVLAGMVTFDFWFLYGKYMHQFEVTADAFMHHVFGF